MNHKPSSRFRFGLRTLLLVTLAAGAGLGWWLRPHVVEQRWPNGQLKSRLTVRRDWDGGRLTAGKQQWWWSNGQLAREGESHGHRLDTRVPNIVVDLENGRAFNPEGEPYPQTPTDLALLWLSFHAPADGAWQVNMSFAETPH